VLNNLVETDVEDRVGMHGRNVEKFGIIQREIRLANMLGASLRAVWKLLSSRLQILLHIAL
jgi:hypothetical protein